MNSITNCGMSQPFFPSYSLSSMLKCHEHIVLMAVSWYESQSEPPCRSPFPGSCAIVPAQWEIGGIQYLWRATWRHPYFKRLNKDIPSVIKAENRTFLTRQAVSSQDILTIIGPYLWCNRSAPQCPFGSFHISVFWFVPGDITGDISLYQKCLMRHSLGWTKRFFLHIVPYKAMDGALFV